VVDAHARATGIESVARKGHVFRLGEYALDEDGDDAFDGVWHGIVAPEGGFVEEG
jgi:hypothetical protein